MKNNNLKIFTGIFLIIIFFAKNAFSLDIKFEAENINTTNENIITATKNIVITDKFGAKIFGDKLVINKKNKNYTITDNVIYQNKDNSILIKSEKIFYNENDNIISSFGKTSVDQNKKYFLKGEDIFFDRNKNKIYSEKKALITDSWRNRIDINEYKILLNDNLLVTENAQLIDSELNTYSIKKLYYDFKQKKILGKDIAVNKNNKLSKKDYLPRIKSKSLIFENDQTNLKKTVYTHCKKRDGCPPWLIESEEIIHDKKNKIINYKNATLKIYDVPVMYFPKFFHPDPTVDRQSGFLTPLINTQKSASYISTPYFFALTDYSDFTFSPRIYDNQKNIYQGEYRHVTKNTKNIIDLSIKNDNAFLTKKNSSETHLFVNSSIKSNFDYFDNSKILINLEKVSSDSYLKSSDIKSPIINSRDTLKSFVKFEGYTENTDFNLSAEIFEDLNQSKNSDKYEFILPNFNLSKNLETSLSGTLSMNNTGYSKHYKTNINEKILVNDFIYKSMDSINRLGFVNNYEIFFKNFNSDSKNSNILKRKKQHDLEGIIQFNSKLPLKKIGNNYDSTLTPIFSAKFNPYPNKNIMNDVRIIDYNNIFSIDRLSSQKTLEGGESITIGNEYKIFDKLDNEIFGLNLATSLKDKVNNDLPANSSLNQKTSNIVGQMNLKTNEFIEFEYDFFADNNLGKFNYHKINTEFKVNNFITSFQFIEESNPIGVESYIANETSFNFNKNKSLLFRTRKNKKTNLTEYYNLLYQYKMDCLIAGIEYNKKYYSSEGVTPEESIFFSVTLMPFDNKINLPGIDK